ncbi:MAG: hypothetical protein PWP11_2934 [Thauera sp.]|jgi:hypothetical protein|nr:hypothetical protein [Thauera sp.]
MLNECSIEQRGKLTIVLWEKLAFFQGGGA